MTDPLQRRLLRISVVSLAASFAVLIAGLTVLERRLQGVVFIVYWFGCFVLVVAAIFAAVLDLWIVRRQARADRRELARQVFSQPAPARRPPSNGSRGGGQADSSGSGSPGHAA